jgi:hypothetical protein
MCSEGERWPTIGRPILYLEPVNSGEWNIGIDPDLLQIGNSPGRIHVKDSHLASVGLTVITFKFLQLLNVLGFVCSNLQHVKSW